MVTSLFCLRQKVTLTKQDLQILNNNPDWVFYLTFLFINYKCEYTIKLTNLAKSAGQLTNCSTSKKLRYKNLCASLILFSGDAGLFFTFLSIWIFLIIVLDTRVGAKTVNVQGISLR